MALRQLAGISDVVGRQTRAQTKAVKGRGKAQPEAEAEEAAASPAPAAAPPPRARAAPRAKQSTPLKAAAAKGGAKLTADQAKKVALFMRTTGGSDSDALECLVEVDGWDVEAAVDSYYTGGRADRAGRRGGARAVEALFRRYKGEAWAGGRKEAWHRKKSQQTTKRKPPHTPPSPSSVRLFARGGPGSVVGSGTAVSARCTPLRTTFRARWAGVGGGERDGRFSEVYAFAYDFSREKGQKCVQLDSALAMWRLLFSAVPGQQWPLVGEWCSFLERAHKGKAVPKDTWLQLLDFVKSVKPDLSNFDEHSSWPYLIDEFVDHLRTQRKQEGEGQP
ncbi:DCN1-like protein 1 [Tetrabaena socialis]|uniref:Defective in cullin neddylation protein n=1 Tax=Tetrabaena socialis TaxID=47790 RepID=A0A2J7ZR17_9CHLO|nr:DCN1-like protein 1 [Tetrabaena socialis]|eukprot:PNH02714.1 DCN1-like protein 1 [Tetrabaena socialis]